MNFSSTVTEQSKIFPDVSYTLRKMTRGRRIQFDLAIADQLVKLRDISTERELIEEELKPARDKAKAGPCTCDHPESEHNPQSFACMVEGCGCRMPQFTKAQLAKLGDNINRERQIERNDIQPVLVRWGLASITGLEIDGAPATADSIIESGDERLCEEIATRISEVMSMADPERKNSDSPTTSGVPVDGATNVSSASGVSANGSTKPKEEIAAGISLVQSA